MDYIDLGATLFVPATHKALFEIVCEGKYKALKSILIDTEDGIDEKDLAKAKEQIQKLLLQYEKKELYLFLRPKDAECLEEFLSMKGIEKVDGFILPKFSLQNSANYLHLLEKKEFYIMPSIEGSELFERDKLKTLRDILLKYKNKILLVRFGLEDMLKQLGMKRSSDLSIFDYSVTTNVLGELLSLFKSSGFAVSGGVYPYFKNTDGFIKDVKRDLREGLFSKTLIHPNQITLTNELYKVDEEEYLWAKAIVQSDTNIIRYKDTMAESKTMLPYATEVLRRFDVYGLRT